MRPAAVVIILLTVAAGVRGQPEDVPAELVVAFDRGGAARISLAVIPPPGAPDKLPTLFRKVTAARPADWRPVNFRKVGPRWVWLFDSPPAPAEGPARRPLDLGPLLAVLREADVPTLRLWVELNRFGNVACKLPGVRPKPHWPSLVYRTDLATDDPAPAIELLRGRPAGPPRTIVPQAGRWSLALAGLTLLVMPLLAVRIRRLAATAPVDRLGHALWRLMTHGPLVTTFAWYVALGLTGGLAQTAGWLDRPHLPNWLLRCVLLFAVAPAAATLLAARIARPAFERLRAADWVGLDVLDVAPWAAGLRLVAIVLTASAAALFLDLLIEPGVIVLFLACVTGLRASVMSWPRGEFVELPDGELVDRVRSFADKLRVRIKAVGTAVSATRRAEVIPAGNVTLTAPLLRDFTPPAVDALVAQRFALQAQRAGFRAAGVAGSALAVASWFVASGCLYAGVWFTERLASDVVDWVPLLAALSLAMFELPVRLMTRAKIFAADDRAAALADPGTLVAAVAEQDRRRGEPLDRPWFEDTLLYSPSAARRAAALARRHGWTAEDVDRLLTAPVGADPARYDVPLPPVLERPVPNPAVAATVVAMVALPLAFAYAATACPPGAARAAVIAAGVPGVPLLYGAVLWLVRVRRDAAADRALSRTLQAEGVDPVALSGVLVAFAPDAEPHAYNGTTQWDLGYLVPAGRRLVFVGRRARAAVPWAKADVAVVGPRPAARVVVAWHGGAFSVWPAGRAPWRSGPPAAELRARLLEWRDDAVTAGPLPDAWAGLPPPPPTPEGAKPLREAWNIRKVLTTIGMLGGLVLMVSGALGLEERADWLPWYAESLVMVTVFAYAWPAYWLSRRYRPHPPEL
jgi:hypothetical protein